jgi:hypothetical protein
MGKLLNMKYGDLFDYIEERVTLAQFTDGGSTAGTYQLKQSIPVGAKVLHTLVTDVEAFAGDTSAVLVVGDGTDADRYNTGTPSVFAAADMVAMGAVSGTAIHAAAADVTLTVTSGSDFGAVTGGALTIRIIYALGG